MQLHMRMQRKLGSHRSPGGCQWRPAMPGWLVVAVAATMGLLLGLLIQPATQLAAFPWQCSAPPPSDLLGLQHEQELPPLSPHDISPPTPLEPLESVYARQSGWNWARAVCDPHSLQVDASGAVAEHAVVARALAIFRACGVVALAGATSVGWRY